MNKGYLREGHREVRQKPESEARKTRYSRCRSNKVPPNAWKHHQLPPSTDSGRDGECGTRTFFALQIRWYIVAVHPVL